MSNIGTKMLQAAAGVSSFVPARYLVTYESSGKIYDIQNNYSDVTSTFKPTNVTSWAGSNETMYHGWQDNGYRGKYIGFGGWGRDASIGGAIWNISNPSSQWTGYNNYDGLVYTFGSSGNAIVPRIVPQGNSGNFFWFYCNDVLEVGVNRITSPSSTNTGSQASQLIANTTYQAVTWGNYIVYNYGAAQNYLYLASFNPTTGATANITSDNSIANGYTAVTPAISKSGNVIAAVNDTVPNATSAIKVWDSYNITEYDGSTKVLQGTYTSLVYPSAVRSVASADAIEALAISDDDRWIAASWKSNSSPYWGIVLWDRNNGYATTNVTLPVGSGTNARPKSITFYPDNDTFFVSGYAQAQCVLCSASSGSYLRNFSSFGANAESIMSSSMGATVLPEDWTDGLY